MSEEQKRDVKITCDLTDQEAWDLAQFLRRFCFETVAQHAVDQDETYRMIYALNIVQKALKDVGYAPR